jgi:hypothetical protein
MTEIAPPAWPVRAVASALTLVAAMAALPAHANLLANGSFENLRGTWRDNSGGQGFMKLQPGEVDVLPGWQLAWPGRDVIWIRDANPFGTLASDGSFHLDLTGSTDGPTFNGVATAFDTTPGQRYRLRLDLGVNNGPCGGVDCSGPVGVQVVVVGALATSVLDFAPAGPGSQWRRFEFEFTASEVRSSLRIEGVQGAGKRYIGLDNVEVVATAALPVPEPATALLWVAGLAAVAARCRRSSRRPAQAFAYLRSHLAQRLGGG